MRERTTWNVDQIAKSAGLKKVADPYTMNQDHPNPPGDKYITGDPSSFGEDVHPSKDTWEAEYSGGQVKRNEIGMPEMRGDTFNHPEKTASEEVLTKKAALCTAIARKVLPKTASSIEVEDQALSFMHLPDADVMATYTRLAAQDQQQQQQDQGKQAQDQQGQQQQDQGQQQQKQGGQMPPQFRENAEKKKEEAESKKDQGQGKQAQQDQGQQDQGQQDQGQKQANQQQVAQLQQQAQQIQQQIAQLQQQQAQAQQQAQQLQQQAQQQQAPMQVQAQQSDVQAQAQQLQQQAAQLQQQAQQLLQQQAQGQGQVQSQEVQMAQAIQQAMANGQDPIQAAQQCLAQILGQQQAQGNDSAMIDAMLAQQEQAPVGEMGIEMETSPMDVNEAQLGPEDNVLAQLFASNQEVRAAQQAQGQDPDQGQDQGQQQKQAMVRNASTRTVGTRPSSGVSQIGGLPSAGNGGGDKLSGLWNSAPDVSEAFGLPTSR